MLRWLSRCLARFVDRGGRGGGLRTPLRPSTCQGCPCACLRRAQKPQPVPVWPNLPRLAAHLVAAGLVDLDELLGHLTPSDEAMRKVGSCRGVFVYVHACVCVCVCVCVCGVGEGFFTPSDDAVRKVGSRRGLCVCLCVCTCVWGVGGQTPSDNALRKVGSRVGVCGVWMCGCVGVSRPQAAPCAAAPRLCLTGVRLCGT